MSNSLPNRRSFLGASALTGTVLGLPLVSKGAPAIHVRPESQPVVIASVNGFEHKNGGTETTVEKAFRLMQEGSDVLDALIAGVNICELDPEDTSVGYGGLPDADGFVTLDSCCMHGPKRQAGGVAALQGVRTPSLVAQAVAQTTDHHLLVGAGAQTFARNMGFTIEADLNTEKSRGLWLEWKRRTDPDHYLNPADRAAAGLRVGLQMVAEGKIHPAHFWGTINCLGVNRTGDVCGVTTTSGLAWKISGRVGDSPILGAGLYVDNDIGAAGSTGRGEANLYNLSSFLIVELLRQGKHPRDAGMEALQRIRKNTVEKRLLNDAGNPRFNVNFYILAKSGQHASVALYPGRDDNYSVCDERGGRHEPVECVFDQPLPEN